MIQIHFFNLTSTLLPVLNFAIFSFFLLARTGFAVDENFTICSQPRNCGRLNIKFPFFIQEQRENRCGYPGFNIFCRNKTQPVLSLPDGDFIIHDIFYQSQSLHVSKDVDFDRDAICSHSIRNMSFTEDRRYLPSNQGEIFLLFNCNLTSQLSWELSRYKVTCAAENETNTTLAVFNNDPMLDFALNYCNETVVLPVGTTVYEGEGTVEDIVNGGFLLKWTASNCSICEASGGKCGFDYSTYHFKCFCPDRPHAWHCTPAKNKLGLKLGLGLMDTWWLSSKVGHSLYMMLSVGIGCPTLIILIFSVYILRCRCKQKYASSNFLRGKTLSHSDPSSKSDLESSSSTVCFGLPIFSYAELVEATNNFDDQKELGDGGFGTVYHGKLRDGREVAVKRLYQHNYRRLEQFSNEVEILTRLRHKNLVSLYGCTSRRSRKLLLVYEFIPNGTVADHLHGGLAQSGSLTWPIRMSIAIETATALAYLHASGIIHRDVKTNNILLDDNFSVKVADFGLSRLFPNDVTHISTAPQGTPGYVDPEYHRCYQLTEKSDVYSFGVVLIELISSMPAVDITRHTQEINLANLAIDKIQKCAFGELIDPNLGNESDEEVTRMAISVAELSVRCLQQEKEVRPSMEEVLKELQKIQSGDYKLENVQDEEEHTDSMGPRTAPPPPSPSTADQISLLKNIRQPPSPVSVTDKWISCSSTPNFSG